MEYIWGGLNNTSLYDTLPPNRISYTDPICLWRDHRSQIWPKQTKAKEATNQRREPGTLRRWSSRPGLLWGHWWMIWGHTAREEDRETGKRITNYFRIIFFFYKIFFAVISLTSFKTVDARLPSQQVTAGHSRLLSVYSLAAQPTLKQFRVHRRRAHSHPLAHLPTPLPLPRGCLPALQAQREEV